MLDVNDTFTAPMFAKRLDRLIPLAINGASKRKLSVLHFNDQAITVGFGSGESASFNAVFLRDSCTSPTSVDPASRQKTFTTSSIANGLKIFEIPHIRRDPESGQDHLDVVWKQGDGSFHKSTYCESFLKNHSRPDVTHQNTVFKKDLWDNKKLTQNITDLSVSYGDYFCRSGRGFTSALDNVDKFGLAFVDDIPEPFDNQSITPENEGKWPVAQLASRFGYIKKTFYGNLFDVKQEKNAKNIANTSTFLPLHMDLLYYESPPGLQLLHFIQNSTDGGENVFSDAFLAAEIIRDNDPSAYEAMKEVPITYHYNNNNEYYYYSRPVIVEEPYDVDQITGHRKVKEVNYSPPFQGPFQLSTYSTQYGHLWRDFLRGLSLFEEIVNNPKNQYQVKMKEGSCVIFDNRRILHSRLAFSGSNGGDRWLMGCYVDGDSFRSKLRMRHGLNLNP